MEARDNLPRRGELEQGTDVHKHRSEGVVQDHLDGDRRRGLVDPLSGALPPPDALESQMVQLGVPEKQKERARQTFYGSARVAGFLDPTNGQFVRPAVRVHEANAQSFGEKKIEEPEQYEGLENRENARRHPFIEGLLKELPDEGENWPVRERTKWLRLAAQAFEMIYKGEGEIEISEKIKETAPHSEAPS